MLPYAYCIYNFVIIVLSLGNGMELCTFGPYEQKQHGSFPFIYSFLYFSLAFLHERQNRLSIQRRQGFRF